MRELVQLADRAEEFEQLGTRLFAISTEPREKLTDLQERLGDKVTLLSDPDGKAVEAFGMIDPGSMPKKGMARSGTFLLERDGTVRHSWIAETYRSRPTPDEILDRLR